MEIITTCRNRESCEINCPIEKLWPLFRTLDFATLFSQKIVKSTEFLEGSKPNSIPALVRINLADGAVWTVSINEISDLSHSIVYEIV